MINCWIIVADKMSQVLTAVWYLSRTRRLCEGKTVKKIHGKIINEHNNRFSMKFACFCLFGIFFGFLKEIYNEIKIDVTELDHFCSKKYSIWPIIFKLNIFWPILSIFPLIVLSERRDLRLCFDMWQIAHAQ